MRSHANAQSYNSYMFGEDLFPPWGGEGPRGTGKTFIAMLLSSFITIHDHKASDWNDDFLSSIALFYNKKASYLNDGFLSSFVIFYDKKASDLNDGFLSSFVLFYNY